MTRLCAQLAGRGRPVGCAQLACGDDVWHTLRTFFVAPPGRRSGDASAALPAGWQERFERLARDRGLDGHPVELAIVPAGFLLEIAAYGLPVRMPHWSFGVRYLHQLAHHHMGRSHLFEVMFPGDPCRAYLSDGNGVAENALVTAHDLGHADFVQRNAMFRHALAMTGDHVLERSAARARRVERARARFGHQRVEAVLDAALAASSSRMTPAAMGAVWACRRRNRSWATWPGSGAGPSSCIPSISGGCRASSQATRRAPEPCGRQRR